MCLSHLLRVFRVHDPPDGLVLPQGLEGAAEDALNSRHSLKHENKFHIFFLILLGKPTVAHTSFLRVWRDLQVDRGEPDLGGVAADDLAAQVALLPDCQPAIFRDILKSFLREIGLFLYLNSIPLSPTLPPDSIWVFELPQWSQEKEEMMTSR